MWRFGFRKVRLKFQSALNQVLYSVEEVWNCTVWDPRQHRSSWETTVGCPKHGLWTLSMWEGGGWPILPLTWFCGARAQNLSYKRQKSRKCPTFRDHRGFKGNFTGQSCLGSLSQVEVRPGTSCRWCRSGGCRRTAEPALRLGCCPTASQSTSTRCLPSRRTGRCNRCWSGERRVVALFQFRIYWVPVRSF